MRIPSSKGDHSKKREPVGLPLRRPGVWNKCHVSPHDVAFSV